MQVNVDQQVPVFKSYAAERTRGLYNVAAQDGSRFRLTVELPLADTDWRVGVIVGPSGSGKSSIARELLTKGFTEWSGGDWEQDRPIIEVLGADNYAKATAALAAVGLGSVPSWLRPHHVLSTGEQFRADMAGLLLSGEQRVVLDEFTSVLDRRVAQVGANAFVKSWRRKSDRQVILISCHYDILEWTQPDWWVDTAEGLDELDEDREVIAAHEGGFQDASDRSRYRGKAIGEVTV